jgi:hypothetical protein
MNDSTMISLKHLCPPPDAEKKYLTTRPWIVKPFNRAEAVSIRWNEEKNNYELAPSFCTPVAWHPNRTALWELMFGEPQGHVWNRFVRSFYYIMPDAVKLGRQLRTVKSYLAFDWLTNVALPRFNQYDPIDYVKYCKDCLKYDPVRKSFWVDDVGCYGFGDMDPSWWAYNSLRDTFNDNLYPIDDVCKWHLAQMFPVKPITKKRII